MKRHHFMTVFCMGVMTAGMAVAASYEDSVVAQLRAQGYKSIAVERTLLGRVKISAGLNGGRREIIINPRTGEVLRDLWIGADGDVASPRIASASSDGNTSNSGSSTGGTSNGGTTNGDDDTGGSDTGGSDTGGSGTGTGDTDGTDNSGSDSDTDEDEGPDEDNDADTDDGDDSDEN